MAEKASKSFIISTQQSLGVRAARQLAVTTKSRPMMEEITPRWFLSFLPWLSLEAGTYRLNKRKKYFVEKLRLEVQVKDSQIIAKPDELRKIRLFENTKESILHEILNAFHIERFEKGFVLIHEGDESEKLYILVEGEVEVSTTGSREEKLILKQLAHGDYFGEIAFTSGKKRKADATALTHVVLLSLDKKDLSDIFERHPQIKNSLIEASESYLEEEINEYGERKVALESGYEGEPEIPSSFVEYEEHPEEISLSVIQTMLAMHTRVSDLYNDPMVQLDEQIRLSVQAMKEQQEFEIINNKHFGLINQVNSQMRVKARYGTPTPDDMDELLARVWKRPAIFLAHPKAIAAFAREATRRGVPPATINFFGSPFLTWRGVPIVPCDKMLVDGKMRSDLQFGKTNILLMRLGEAEQGVVGLHQPGIPDEKLFPSLSVKFNGIDSRSIAHYALSLYFSVAVLTDDAIGMLENVEVGFYHDYHHEYKK